ncbi:hypothetical protein DFH06DRAFT_1093802 [Mycena polygramma]|nr:hypothetical protein DFH06DRAFT_1093802 [Mycena polygramma]
MGKRKTPKQQAGLSHARTSRWKKENILPTHSSPPRTTTRARQYLTTLEDRIRSQDEEINALHAINSELLSDNTNLYNKLDESTLQIVALQKQNTVSAQELAETSAQLDDAQHTISMQDALIRQKEQRINRLIRDKSLLSTKAASAKQQLLAAVLRAETAEGLSKSDSLRIESLLSTISQLDKRLDSHLLKNKEIYKSLRATEMREKRAKVSLKKVRKELRTKSKWSGTNRRAYTQQYRTLALAFTRAGCAQARLGPLLARVGKVFGVQIKRSMSRRTVGRVITEAGIKVRMQLGYELARTKAICLSSDGTSHRNIKYEARHLTYAAPTYNSDPNAPQTAFRTRVVEVNHALDHTAQSQYEGWDIVNQKIVDAYTNSPLGSRDLLQGNSWELDDLWRKMVAYNSDHASDVRCAAGKCITRKRSVAESDLGREEIEAMTEEALEEVLWEVVQEMVDDPAGLDESALSDDVRTEALQGLAAHLGSVTFDDLPESQQLLLTRTIIAGCCEHKDHNCSYAGVVAMNAAWEELGLTPPVLLANKDNAATIALGESADSEAVERALKASQRGGYKLVQICGGLFRHKDDKKGHQDLHRHFFSKLKFEITGERTTVKFPDVSNTRFGTCFSGASEIVTFHCGYRRFMLIIHDSKKIPGFNHTEQNAWNGIEDDGTMTDCCVMTLYKNAFSDGYVAASRAAGVNHLDLGPLHEKMIAHIEKVIANPDLVLDPTTPCEEATVDGLPFRDQFTVDSVHFMASRLPHLEAILVAFLKGTLPAWRRFSSEFAADGLINSLTPAEKLLIMIPPTNDANESLLGGWRVHSRTRSASTVAHFSAQEAYHRNDTEAFAEAMLQTEEDSLYIMRLARLEDASGEMRKFRDDLLAFKQRAAEDARAKQQAKADDAAARLAELKAVTVIEDPEKLGKLKKDALRVQLDVRRELLKESVLAAMKLKEVKNKPEMLKAILASDERRLKLPSSLTTVSNAP